MIQHRLAIVVWLVLVLLAGRPVDGKTETLPRGAYQAIDHTGDTRPYFTGRIEQDTMWRDTVYVGGDVTIAAEATLTLAPNTQVLFLPYRDDARGGLDTTRAELIVEGRLAAHAGGIVFRSADAGSLGADWYGLVVERGGQADVSHAAIRDGLRCLYAKRGGRVTMDSIAFANCGKPTAPADAAGLSMSRRSAQPLPALRVGEKTDRQRSKRVDRVVNKSNAETDPAEITIHIRREHKGVVSALLEAFDEGTLITGIAKLDALAATYGLIGIYRKGSRSSSPHRYRFLLTFPPGADVVAIAKAYGNVSYIQSVESVKPADSYFLNDRAITRIPTKVGLGMLTLGGTAFIVYETLKPDEDEDDFGDPPGLGAAVSVWFGLLVGYPVGVYLADPVESSFWMTCVGHSVGFLGGIESIGETGWVPVFGVAVMASELSRLLPKRFRNPNPFKWLFGKFGQPIPRVSFGLVPESQRGLSAVAALRF